MYILYIIYIYVYIIYNIYIFLYINNSANYTVEILIEIQQL